MDMKMDFHLISMYLFTISTEFLDKFGCLKPFEMEGVEKLNHLLKMAFYRSTNHGSNGKAVSEQVRSLLLLQYTQIYRKNFKKFRINFIFQINCIFIKRIRINGKRNYKNQRNI